MVVDGGCVRDHDHRKRGERCPPLAGSVNDDGIVAARAEEAITREGA
jgi:hypothetical protein